MLIEHQHPDNKSMVVSVLGAPNVGKSTMINYLLGMNLTAVSRCPQMTRNRFHCVVNVDRTQLILVDTPGIHRSNKEFNKRLNQQAREGAEGADLNLLLVDISKEILAQIVDFRDTFKESLTNTWLLFTKSDLVGEVENLPLAEVFTKAQELIPALSKYFVISTKSESNMNLLTGALCDQALPGPHLYTDGSVSNKNERFFVTEYIREQAFELLRDELPHELAVIIDEYKDFRDKEERGKLASHISASIIVNRPSQRAIVIGAKGAMIKNIGTRARQKIEAMVGGQVHLNLHVKVTPNWFKNNRILEEIGLPRAANSNRVWKKRSS